MKNISCPHRNKLKEVTFIFVLIFILTNACFAQAKETSRVSAKIKVTGLRSTVFANILLYLSVGINEKYLTTTQNRTVINKKRDRVGHYNIEFSNIEKYNDATHYAIYGKLLNNKQSIVGYIPVKIGPMSDFIRNEHLSISVQAVLDAQEACLKSYPFSQHNMTGCIKNENVNLILFSLKQMIEQHIVKSRPEWKNIYLLFQKNSKFFSRASPEYLTRILEFLNTYSKLVESTYNTDKSNIGFHEFYVKYLNSITNIDVDGIQVFGDRLGDYIFQQLKEEFTKHLEHLLFVVDDTLRIYQKKREYEKCINLSSVIFQNIPGQEVVLELIKTDAQIRESIYHTMVAATTCGQYYYVSNSSDQAPKVGDIPSATSFLLSKQEGQDFIASFIALFEKLESLGFMPRRGRKQVKLIEKHYNVYINNNIHE